VFIPHDFTWVLEHEMVDAPPGGEQLMELGSFRELIRHF
jgi:putative hydrolase of the HAD superfamily